MSSKEFIFQGFTKRTHVEALNELFYNDEIEQVILSVAFITESGIDQIHDHLLKNNDKLLVLAGIRNDITSYQGLLKLSKIGGTLYAVDTGFRAVVFHPKIYLVRGKHVSKMLIGSANLTLGGLNNNIEAGMLITFDMADKGDVAAIDEIVQQLESTPPAYPDNIFAIEDEAIVEQMLNDGRLIDEAVKPPPRSTSIKSKASAGSKVPRIALKVATLLRKYAPTPAKARAEKPAPAAPAAPPGAAPVLVREAEANADFPIGASYELLWQSKDLTRRDLGVPDGKNTHKTGSINLDKGLLPADIDHRPFFREVVFDALNWKPRTETTEEAYAKFHLVLRGVSYGEFDLAIRHTTSKDSASYRQNNAMTRLSWGAIAEYVGQEDLIGRTLSLSRDMGDPERYMLEID